MKKLFLLSFIVSIFYTACKDKCECEVCVFNPPGHYEEVEYPISCFNECFFNYELLGKQYQFLSDGLADWESVHCKSEPDTCSHVVNIILAEKSFKFMMQRIEGSEDSLQFFQSFGTKLPLRLPDSILWGQRIMSASFELNDNCNQSYFTTNTGFPDRNYVIIDTAIYMGKLSDIVYGYNIIGSINADFIIDNYTENVIGQFSVTKKIVFLED